MKSVAARVLSTWIWVATWMGAAISLGQGTIQIQVLDEASQEPVPARLQFVKSPRKVAKPNKIIASEEHWLIDQDLSLSMANGEYEFLVKRGPEFKDLRGGFTIERKAKDIVTLEIPRSVDMHAEKWYSGDHMTTIPSEVLSRWQAADAIDMAVSVAGQSRSSASKPGKTIGGAKPNQNAESADRQTTVGLMLQSSGVLHQWATGTILIHGSDDRENDPATAAPENATQNEEPSSTNETKQSSLLSVYDVLMRNKQTDTHTIELAQPWQRDVPILLATEAIHAVQLLSTYNRSSEDFRIQWSSSVGSNRVLGQVTGKLAGSKWTSDIFVPIETDDRARYKDGRGAGRLAESIYWQMLESGLRLTPTAASGFAATDSLAGYNRVYVHSDDVPTQESWWKAIKLGRTMVTNGPLLRTKINSLPPGSVQASYRGRPIPLDIEVELTVRDPVEYLDVVFNGNTIYSARLEDHYRKGEFPPIEVEESGWLVVRVVTSHTKGYRLVTTAPYYFEFDGKNRVNKSSVEFFQRWLEFASADLLANATDSDALKPLLERAKSYWMNRSSNP